MDKKNKKLELFEYPQSFKNFIHHWFYKLIATELFENYNINFVFKSSDELSENSNDGFTVMDIDTSEAYLSADVNVYPKAYRVFLQEGELLFIKKFIIHELSHIITTPVEWLARSRFITDEILTIQNEKLTEKLSRLMAYYFEKEGYLKK